MTMKESRINAWPKSLLNSPEETVYILRKEFIPKKLIVQKLHSLLLLLLVILDQGEFIKMCNSISLA